MLVELGIFIALSNLVERGSTVLSCSLTSFAHGNTFIISDGPLQEVIDLTLFASHKIWSKRWTGDE